MAIGAVQVNISLVVYDQTYQEAKDLRDRVEQFLTGEPDASLTLYQITEAPSV